MSDWRGKTSRSWAPQHSRQEAHRPEAKLPEGDWVFFLLDTVPHLDLRRFYAPYEAAPRGAPPFDPQMMGCLLLYADWVGVFASRKLAQACERHLACIAIVGEHRPDGRTISDFRTLHLAAFCDVFVQVRRIAGGAGLVTLGNVSTDGTTLQGNASRHNTMRYGYMQQAVERWRAAIAALVTQAHQQATEDDAALGSRRGDAWPAALARRAERLATIEAAMKRLEARATGEAEAERQRRADAEAERQRTGHRRRGRAPKAGAETPEDTAQMRCTNPELPSMQTTNQGWDDCGHAHVRVDGASPIIVAGAVPAETNEKPQAVPLAQLMAAHLEQAALERPKDAAGTVQKIPAP